MRVLFTTQPAYGHFHVMVPLATALVERGHDVAFASGKQFGAVIKNAGFRHYVCGLDLDGTADGLHGLPEFAALASEAGEDRALHALLGFVKILSPGMADDLLPLMSSFAPDLIVRDTMDLGGYIAAEKTGIPHVTITWSSYIPVRELCAGPIAELRERYGLPRDEGLRSLDSYFVTSFLPTSWDFPMPPYPPVTHRFSAQPFDGSPPEGIPDWLNHLREQPTVHASLGTAFNDEPAVFSAMVDAFRNVPINLIITTGKGSENHWAVSLPDNIRVEKYIPLSRVFPLCDAVICHGGYNTLATALWHGLPMVLIPLAADQPANAHNCERLGVGITVPGFPPAPDAIRASVEMVLNSARYAENARTLQMEMKRLPDLSIAVKRLEVLAREKQPQLNDTARRTG
jgi:UDP:flavonoid glycosyltransferase YjiC (YdhE family)